MRPLRRLVGRSWKISEFDLRVLSQLHQQSCVLEKHEEKIARHTSIQTKVAWLQLLFGVITTGLLIYVAILQFQAADRQATIADRQAKLEYAKVAPQFTARSNQYTAQNGTADRNSFPKSLEIRILRGEAALESISPVQELRVSRIARVHNTCVLRIGNYFKPKPGNIIDFVTTPAFERISADPAWFQDRAHDDFVIVSPENTLATIKYKDVFGEIRTKRYFGANGIIEEIPSGDFPKSSIYETIDVNFFGNSIRVPGSFKLTGSEPVTVGCRSLLGLSGGRVSFF